MNRGATLIETLLALALSSIVMTLFVTASIHMSSAQLMNKDVVIAMDIAQNGLEIASNIIKRDWSLVEYLTSDEDATYYPKLNEDDHYVILSGIGMTNNKFRHELKFSYAYRDDNGNIVDSGGLVDQHTVRINSSVSLQNKSLKLPIQLITYVSKQ